jgi:hypothetical protein
MFHPLLLPDHPLAIDEPQLLLPQRKLWVPKRGLIPFASPMLMGAAAGGGGGGAAPYGTHAYWRFSPQTMNTDTYVGWTNIAMFDGSNVQITTTGQTYSEGGAGTQGAHGASAPFDAAGNSTYWLRSGAPSWVQIQFSVPQAPARFEFTCESVSRSVIDFIIQSSDNGTTWTDALRVWEPSHDVTNSIRAWPQDFTGGKVKALGFEVSETQAAGLAAMDEAEFHATVGGADICNGGAAWAVGSAVSGTGTSAAGLFDNGSLTTQFLHSNLPATVYYAFPTTVAVPAEFSLKNYSSTNYSWKDFKAFSAVDVSLTKTYLKTITGENWASVPLTKTYSIP